MGCDGNLGGATVAGDVITAVGGGGLPLARFSSSVGDRTENDDFFGGGTGGGGVACWTGWVSVKGASLPTEERGNSGFVGEEERRGEEGVREEGVGEAG